MVHGSLVRDGDDVRLDLVLLPTDGGAAPLARASVSSAPDSIAALTDSAVHVLLREVWTGDRRQPRASRRRSGPARCRRCAPSWRANGRLSVAGGTARRFLRARRMADSAFWIAHAREQYAISWSTRSRRTAWSSSAAPPRRAAGIGAPDRRGKSTCDRRTASRSSSIAPASARAVPQLLVRLARLRRRADAQRSAAGTLARRGAAGFQRALELNPNLIPVHEHLMLVALQDRDTAAAAQGLRELERLDAGPSLTADGYGNRMLQFRFLDAIVRGDSGLTRVLADSIARDPAPEAERDGSFYDAFLYGFPAEQIRVSTQVLRVGGSPGRQKVHGRLLALSWAERGAWDSALVAMDRLVRSGTDSTAALRAYGLAVVGAWLGAVDQREADVRRKAAVTAAQGNAADRAEVAWLDGLMAVTRRGRVGIAEARAALQKSGDPAAGALDRSLAAFDDGLTGPAAAAGKAMAELEWQQAAIGAPAFAQHPFTIGVDRLAAARWLAESGDGDQALRLLAVRGWAFPASSEHAVQHHADGIGGPGAGPDRGAAGAR